MNAQQQIQQIQQEAAARIAAIQAAESALAATVAANVMSEQERAEQEQRAAEIAAAVDQWHAERLPALAAEFDQYAVEVAALRAKHKMAVDLLRAIPTERNALAGRIANAIEKAIKERLALPDVTDRNRIGIENEIRSRLVDGRNMRIGVDHHLKEIWSARGWFVTPLAFD